MILSPRLLLPVFLQWFDQLEIRSVPRGQPGPDLPSIYMLWNRTGGLTYVGMSGSVRHRWARHESACRFSLAEWDRGSYFFPGLPDESDRLILEACLIVLLHPPRNRGLNLGLSKKGVYAVRYRRGEGAAQE